MSWQLGREIWQGDSRRSSSCRWFETCSVATNQDRRLLRYVAFTSTRRRTGKTRFWRSAWTGSPKRASWFSGSGGSQSGSSWSARTKRGSQSEKPSCAPEQNTGLEGVFRRGGEGHVWFELLPGDGRAAELALVMSSDDKVCPAGKHGYLKPVFEETAREHPEHRFQRVATGVPGFYDCTVNCRVGK